MTRDRLPTFTALMVGLAVPLALGCSPVYPPSPQAPTSPAETAPATPLAEQGRLQAEQIAIGGVALTMTETDIRQALGEPNAVVDEESGCCGLLRRLEYPTLTIGLIKGDGTNPDFIYALRTTSPGVSSSGVAVGDTSQRALEIYGPPAETVIENSQRSLIYEVNIAADRLVFELENDVITAIGFYSLLN